MGAMDWMDFDRWPECVSLERPGIVFEVQNGDGLSLLTTCMVPLEVPGEWKTPPLRFRVVPEPMPRHSEPLPGHQPGT
jgi:hypothetical protein